MTKTLMTAVLVACALLAGNSYAGAQQDKMKACNADAKTKALKGDERKQFMSECLSAKSEEPAKPMKQQDKMKACNADAKTKALKGDERKQFMSECLSAK